MAKAEWGTKRQCPNCGAKFYDLGKPHPITCPKCGHVFEADVLLKPRRAKLELKDTAPVARVDDDDSADTPDPDADEEALEDEEDADTPELDEVPLLADDEVELDEDGVPIKRDAPVEDLDEEDIALDDGDDIDEALIEDDEDLGDEEVAEMIEHAGDDKDL